MQKNEKGGRKMTKKLKGKYVFFDVDGTLAEYRFQDKLYAGGCPELGCQSLNSLLFEDLYLKARPLKTMQNVIQTLNPNQVFILGACTTNHEIEQKYKWLAMHYPTIKRENILFIHLTMLKPEVILEYVKHLEISLEEVAFVDDRLDVLRKAEELGITAYHPSSFME